MKKSTLALILAALVALVSWSAVAEEAPLPAAVYVPEGSSYLVTEWDDGLPEYRYIHYETYMLYEVTLHPDTGVLMELKSEHLFDEGGMQVTLDEQQVLSALNQLFPDAQQVAVRLHSDDGIYVYKVQFATPAFTAEVELHPETGALLEQKLDYTRPLIEQKTGGDVQRKKDAEKSGEKHGQSQDQQTDTDGRISKSQAIQIAVDKAGGGKARDVELDKDDGRWIYEGEVIFGDYEYEFEIDAESGRILEWDTERRDRDD